MRRRPALVLLAGAGCQCRKHMPRAAGSKKIFRRQAPVFNRVATDEIRKFMNLALDELADNPIIDELVCWPPRAQRMLSLRACSVMFRKPFIEARMADGELIQCHFIRTSFAADWAEASVILETLTRIEILSEFSFVPVSDRKALVARVLACRDQCIAEANLMYDQGMYAQYLQQFGADCRDLPADTERRIAEARRMLAGG